MRAAGASANQRPIGMTTFLHTRVHQAIYRERYGALTVKDARRMSAVHVTCPRCRTLYFAEQRPLEDDEVETDVADARLRLAWECPDHPHRFSVGEDLSPL